MQLLGYQSSQWLWADPGVEHGGGGGQSQRSRVLTRIKAAMEPLFPVNTTVLEVKYIKLQAYMYIVLIVAE